MLRPLVASKYSNKDTTKGVSTVKVLQLRPSGLYIMYSHAPDKYVANEVSSSGRLNSVSCLYMYVGMDVVVCPSCLTSVLIVEKLTSEPTHRPTPYANLNIGAYITYNYIYIGTC